MLTHKIHNHHPDSADTSQIHMEYIEGWPDTHQDTYLEPYLRPDVGGATSQSHDVDRTQVLMYFRLRRLPPMIHGPKARIKQKRMTSANAPMGQPKIHSTVLIVE